MSQTVYLGDLRYNYTGFLANDCMPLGVAYIKAVMDRDMPEVRSRLFAYPQNLWEAIKNDPPDVLMLSNYVWNEALSVHFARLAKRVRPDTLVVMGGPNLPLEPERQAEFLEKRPEIDVYVVGEGDFLGGDVVAHFLDAGKSIRGLGSREIPSCVYRRPDGSVVVQKTWPRHKEVDEIPSPWLNGSLDEFFDGKLAPLFETNRGCPFTCTFCVQGTSWYTKVHNFEKQRVLTEIEYISKRIHECSPEMGTFRIADSNYGMFERDVELSGKLGEMRKKYGYPKYIDATTGKNRADRIIQSVEKTSGALVLYQAVQSLDETVLKKVKRSTIKLDAYEQILTHIRGRGLRSNSDLILGLPGETLETHVSALYKLLDAGVSQVTNFQLMMLPGSELETLESRREYQFETRFRVLPKNFGIYGGEKVFDVEEIVVSTDTLPFEDYVEARKYALVSGAFWKNNHLDVVLDFGASLGIRRSHWLERCLKLLKESQGEMRSLLDGFVRETKAELFETREQVLEFYGRDENFQKLLNGEIGENLINKYGAMAAFPLWANACELGMEVSRQLFVERGVDREIENFAEFWQDLACFIRHQHAGGATIEEVLTPKFATLRYDIGRWISAGMPKDVNPWRLSKPTEFEFRLTEEGRDVVGSALQVWSIKLQGLAKLITRINMHLMRRAVRKEGETEFVSHLSLETQAPPVASFAAGRTGSKALVATAGC